MQTCANHFALAFGAFAALAACDEQPRSEPVEVLSKDPQLARAVHDPLMVDPDLAWRTEANAVVGLRDGHPLPPIEARNDAADRAREAMRLELLEGGQIPPLPAMNAGEGGASLAELGGAGDMLKAVGGRTDCVEQMDDDLLWSTAMPPTSSIPPHGMVQQAAGVDVGTCVVRVVRYLTPVDVEDVLEYHFTKVDRARFDISLKSQPEAQMIAERRDQKVSVHVREGPGGMSAVDVIHWRK